MLNILKEDAACVRGQLWFIVRWNDAIACARNPFFVKADKIRRGHVTYDWNYWCALCKKQIAFGSVFTKGTTGMGRIGGDMAVCQLCRPCEVVWIPPKQGEDYNRKKVHPKVFRKRYREKSF